MEKRKKIEEAMQSLQRLEEGDDEYIPLNHSALVNPFEQQIKQQVRVEQKI